MAKIILLIVAWRTSLFLNLHLRENYIIMNVESITVNYGYIISWLLEYTLELTSGMLKQTT